MQRFLGFLALLVLLAACGSNWDGPELGDFPAITKKETDAAFTLTPPSSRSPAPFSFTSSDPTIATINGATVTLHGVGTTTITAAQPRDGAYGPTSKSTTLTVTAVACDSGTVRVNGTCAPVACPAHAELVNNQCQAPSTGTATNFVFNNLNWMAVTFSGNYADAKSFCANTYIQGLTGWRLPTLAELKALAGSTQLTDNHWTLGNTWSSTAGTTLSASSHQTIDLHSATGDVAERLDTADSYVTCVKP